MLRLINLITGFLQESPRKWWVRITTSSPYCIYYFGPFQSYREAQAQRNGYIEDLESEGAQAIKVSIRRRQPDVLTICVEDPFIQKNYQGLAASRSSPTESLFAGRG